MKPLPTPLRNKLERAIMDARDAAEAGALAALEAFAVHHYEPYGHMPPEQRKLRNHLRARARQLGDKQDHNGNLDITHLVWECAYEHWHRMLFARFLAENNLLIEPEHGVAISLEECEELAQEEGTDLWTLASRYAQKMLPQIFRPDDPLLQISFAPEHRVKLERLLADLESEIFMASDSLGWVYQFWQGRRKKEVNESGKKIGADELPAVTQLFTEPYMVDFLIHNTLGAWHAGKVLKARTDLASSAKSEQELRDAVSLPGVPWEYLRFVRDDDSTLWKPAAGIFDGWPEAASELKTLDPCCGSGHFIVALLRHLVPIRIAEEGLSVRDAVDAVIRDNLHGLEIDERCTQIAAFAVALSAWTFPGAGGFRPLPDIRIACCGVAPNAKKEEWLEVARLAADSMAQVNDQGLFPDPSKETMWHVQMKNGMEALYELFKQAPVLGSLIDPSKVGYDEVGGYSHSTADFSQLADLMHDMLEKEQVGVGDEMHEMAVAAKGVADAVKLLAGRYHLVITNVPYLARGKQSDILREYIETYHGAAKQDLATAFVERTIGLCNKGGSTALVTPQNWLFLGSYKKLREKLLRDEEWNSVARLGARAFETISGEVVNVALIGISHSLPSSEHQFAGADVAEARDAETKGVELRCSEAVKTIGQKEQLGNPDARVTIDTEHRGDLLCEYGEALVGLQTSDDFMFLCRFWETDFIDKRVWEFMQGTPDSMKVDSGASWLVRWEQGSGILLSLPTAYPTKGLKALGKCGIAIHRMNELYAYHYREERFHQNVAVIIPRDPRQITAIWCYCASSEYNFDVRQIDKSLKVTNSTLTKVPFDYEHWCRTAAEEYPEGLPDPYTDDPTQWLFHGHPCASVIWSGQTKRLEIGPQRTDNTALQIALARLLGYRWPAELDPDMRLSKESRELVAKCEELLPLADKDGIVCIPSVRGEEIAVDRLRAMLAKAYGDSWSPQVEHDILAATGGNASDLEDWLRNEFFEQHCKLFHHRPFIWHIWDGRKRDGFHALVNYHKLAAPDGSGRKLLESLTYSYLGDWITRQKDGVKNGEGGAEDRLIAAEQLQNRLKAILNGEIPFDIFVRWKPIQQQAIGWEPDINDGVRMNIRPFMADDIPGGKKGAGILRWKPNIKWEKDRGTEPHRKKEEYPWFWDGKEFTGDRVNDVHLTIQEKTSAREKGQ